VNVFRALPVWARWTALLAALVVGAELVAVARGPAPVLSPTASVTAAPLRTSAPSPPSHTMVPEVESAAAVAQASVRRVIDGDTAEMRMSSGAVERVRFIGVNTPESTTRHEPLGKEASKYTERALKGATVWLETDLDTRDRYDRLLAYVWMSKPSDRSRTDIRESMFNARLLLDGYANVMTVPPNVRYVDDFLLFEREARAAGRGLWSRVD
jgi:micrococcal nuclease